MPTKAHLIEELNRAKTLLSSWVRAAQSGGNIFGRVMQEPTPERLQEAIKTALTIFDAREKDRLTILRMRRVLKKCEDMMRSELENGYVLTHEPMAGVLWRMSKNTLFGDIEGVLAETE